MSKYFDRFPIISYNGAVAKNLLTKVDFTNKTKKEIFAKFDYVIDENINRPDLLSSITYNSSKYDWMIYLTNQVIDPYHDFYKNERDFVSYMEKKYVTLENSRKVVLFYRNNWASDNDELSEFQYDLLSDAVKKYYMPILNNANQIMGYKRLDEDWMVSTNKIIKLTVANSEWIPDSGYITQGEASANIVSVDRDNHYVFINHVSGTFTEDVLNSTTITAIELMKQNIEDDELPFWAAVTAYDYEYENNELKRYISMIRSSFLQDFESKFLDQIKI